MFAIGNNELNKLSPAYEGMLVKCKKCKKSHKLECGVETTTKKKSTSLMFYKCGKDSYLGAISGKLLG